MGCTGAHCTRMVLRASEKASFSSAAQLLSSVSSSSSSRATACRSLAAVLEKKLWICPVVRNSSTLKRRSPLSLRAYRISRVTCSGSALWPVSWPILNLSSRHFLWSAVNLAAFLDPFRAQPFCSDSTASHCSAWTAKVGWALSPSTSFFA